MNLDMINVLPFVLSVVGFRCGRRDVAEIPSRALPALCSFPFTVCFLFSLLFR